MPALPFVLRTESPRAENEDAAAVWETASGLVVAVADGVGGRANGGNAARFAIQHLEAVAGAPRRDRHVWQRTVEQLDRDLLNDPTTGETTLVVVEITERMIRGVSVGDSEAWLVLPDGHYDLTGSQMGKPFLGSDSAIVVSFEHRNPGMGTLVIASDGLFKYATTDQIATAARLSTLDEAIQSLLNLPRLRSGALPDDLTVCVCRLGKTPPLPPRSRFGMPRRGEPSWIPVWPADAS